MMLGKTRIIWICLTVLASTWHATTASATDRLNVLFIAVDDMRVDLGCYGQHQIHSPNIDRLASKGTLFQKAYCQQAVCNPSRASLLTGRRPDSLQVWDLPTHFRENHPDIVTLPQLFKNNGYHSQCVGKIFHNWRQDDFRGDRPSWSVPSVMHYDRHGSDKAQVSGKLPPNLSSVPRTEIRDVPDNAYFDGQIADLACDALKEQDEQPFFLAVGFWKPHADFNAPKKYWDLYPPDQIKLARHRTAPDRVPPIALHDSREILRAFSKRQPTDEQARVLRRGYYAAISYVDAQIGKLLDEVDRLGLWENTVIVFWSDHGFHLGEHSLWAKTSNFELDAHVPLIIAAPGHAGSQQTQAIVELLDLYPTLADLCDVQPPSDLEGVSLAPLLKQPNLTIKDGALTQHTRPAYPSTDNPLMAMGYSLRTPTHRYTEWRSTDDPGKILAVELYDHTIDPDETKNLAGVTEHSDVQRETARQLSSLVSSVNESN